MTRPDYQPLLDDCTAKLAREQKRANRISWTRLAVFLLTVACAVPGFQHTQWAGPLALLLGTAVFCVLVRRLNRVQADIRFLQARGEVLEAYLARLGDGWRTFPDTGEEFLGEDAPGAGPKPLWEGLPLSISVCRQIPQRPESPGGQALEPHALRPGNPTPAAGRSGALRRLGFPVGATDPLGPAACGEAGRGAEEH